MYIPRPAKLLFQYDDGWNRFIDNNPVDEWQLLCAEKMLACSTCAMGVRRYCCSSPDARIPVSFVKPVNPKPAVHAASKAPSNGLPNSVIFYRTANGNTSPSLCPTSFGLSSTITGTYLTNSFAAPPVPCLNTPRVLG